MLGLNTNFWIVLLGGHEIVSMIGFSMVRGSLERVGEGGLVEGVFSKEVPSSFFFGGLSYV